MIRSIFIAFICWLFTQSVPGQSINFSSEYDRITWPVSLGVSGGLTGDDGQYKRLALFHGHSISFQTGTSTPNFAKNRLYITNVGHVGIGTTNPETLLHVEGLTPFLSTGPGGGYKFRDWKSGAAADTDDWHIYALNGIARIHKLAFGDILNITSSGNVGIGTISPGARLDINGSFRQSSIGEFAIDAPYIEGGRLKILENGNVGIGTINPGSYKLAVEGKIGAREVEVKIGSWADFVFQPGYRLRPLAEVASFIDQYQHLPDIPSEANVKATGISLGEMNAKLLQKIEELTLYVIEQQKQIDQLKPLLRQKDKRR